VELCQQIKTNPATKNIPIILMSADSEIGQKLRGMADGFLQKPFDTQGNARYRR
jgi:CheY-like chemotaxis protein